MVWRKTRIAQLQIRCRGVSIILSASRHEYTRMNVEFGRNYVRRIEIGIANASKTCYSSQQHNVTSKFNPTLKTDSKSPRIRTMKKNTCQILPIAICAELAVVSRAISIGAIANCEAIANLGVFRLRHQCRLLNRSMTRTLSNIPNALCNADLLEIWLTWHVLIIYVDC